MSRNNRGSQRESSSKRGFRNDHTSGNGFVGRTIASSILGPFAFELKSALQKLSVTPIQTIVGILSGCTTIFGVFGYFFGSSPSITNIQSSALPEFLHGFQARILVFFIITASIGWSVAVAGAWLSKGNDYGKTVAAHFTTALGGLFVIALADWLFTKERFSAPNIVFGISISAIAVSIFLLKTRFQMDHISSTSELHARAGLILNFAIATASLVIISSMIGA